MALRFPAAECNVQVSWRQFKCNGASKLIFLKNNIEAGKSLGIAQTACLVATHSTCVSWESWAFPWNIFWTYKHCVLCILHLPLLSLCLPVCHVFHTNRPQTCPLLPFLGWDLMYRTMTYLCICIVCTCSVVRNMFTGRVQCNDMIMQWWQSTVICLVSSLTERTAKARQGQSLVMCCHVNVNVIIRLGCHKNFSHFEKWAMYFNDQ